MRFFFRFVFSSTFPFFSVFKTNISPKHIKSYHIINVTNSTRFCAKRSEVRNRKQKNELNFSHRWNCFETGKVSHVFIVVEEMGRETNKNTYIFTQKGLRSKSYSIRDFVLAFFFLLILRLLSTRVERKTHNKPRM